MKRHFILCLILTVHFAAGQTAEEILSGVTAAYSRVRNYSAQATITADIPFIRILPMHARLYFQQPDQMRIVSKGIAILPRQGFDQVFRAISDRKNYTAVLQGTDSVNGIPVQVVSLLPLSDTMEVILARCWIDHRRHLILRSQITTRTNGTIDASYHYGDAARYSLPDRIVFTVDVKKFKVPKAVAVDLNNNAEDSRKGKDPKKGTIEVRLTGYEINK